MEVTSTADVDVISSSTIDKAGLAPCDHEEADTRIFINARHATLNGMKKILKRTVDIDVVILAIAFTKKLEVEELRVAFGVGKHLRYPPIHKIASSLTTQYYIQFYRSPMHLLGVIRCLEKVRRPHFILRRLKFFVFYYCHRQSSPSSNSECWNASWLYNI